MTGDPANALLFIADDVALDFINTRYGKGDAAVECLDSDASVLAWLERAGFSSKAECAQHAGRPGGLLQAARELRESARSLIEQRKAGGTGDVEILNRFLAAGASYEQVVWKRGQPPGRQRLRTTASSAALLAPVAEAVAHLLVEGDFNLIRPCEGDICTLWFYDRTKSHRRRWCDMAICGNRAKVAAFRERRKER